MKKNFFTIAACLFIAVFLIGCKKESSQLATVDSNGTVSSQRPQAIAKSNKLVLQTFTQNGRTYHFNYSANGILDSITVTGAFPYVYRIWYKGSHLDSVTLFDRGHIVSTNRNFEYKGNLITAFDYFDRMDNAPFAASISIAYDENRRIVSVERGYPNYTVGRIQCSYNANDDVIQWNDFIGNNFTYSYDDGMNPLHVVPDLFAIMVEETWIWEYSFSLHNSVRKTNSKGQATTYQNQYNSSGQLVGKLFSDHSNSFSFTYY